MKRKKKHPIRNILLIGLLAFAVWLFWPEDDYDDYYYDGGNYSNYERYDEQDYYEDEDEGWFSSLFNDLFGDDDDSSYSGNSYSGGSNSGSNSLSSNNSIMEALPSDAIREEQSTIVGNGKDTVTVLVYMNGSNLESDDGSATLDLKEMVAAGSSSKVNVIVQTMGTKKWASDFGIASNRSQIYEVNGRGLTLVNDRLGQLDSTAEKTLKDFVVWGTKNYPADRYMLILWDHGGGPVYGFGYDEYQAEDAALTLDEIQSALRSAGTYFDFIGFDACLMSSLEVCAALYEFCDYTILSEDFEPGIGWYYTGWLKALYKNTSITTIDLGKKIVDDTVNANKTDSNGDSCILAVMDEGMMKVLYTAWMQFAYANENTLLGNNYSRQVRSRGRSMPLGGQEKGFFSDWLSDDDDNYSLEDYYITDIMALASTMNTSESNALASALNNAIVYVNSTGISGETGISVTLPYGDSSFYKSLKVIFNNCGFDNDYVTWLGKFTSAKGSSSYYDYDDFDDSWSSWDDYDDDYDWSLFDLIFGDDSFWEEDDSDWSDDWGYGFFGFW